MNNKSNVTKAMLVLTILIEKDDKVGFIDYLNDNNTKINNQIVGDSFLTNKMNTILFKALDTFVKP